jgi:hypothetical protein
MSRIKTAVCCCAIVYIISTFLFAFSFGTIALNSASLQQNKITKAFKKGV